MTVTLDGENFPRVNVTGQNGTSSTIVWSQTGLNPSVSHTLVVAKAADDESFVPPNVNDALSYASIDTL